MAKRAYHRFSSDHDYSTETTSMWDDYYSSGEEEASQAPPSIAARARQTPDSEDDYWTANVR